MLTFIVPVKSKKVTKSWEYFSKLFRRTLSSICNQTSQEFRVVVVCHEKPDTNFSHPKVEFIYVDFDAPNLAEAPPEKHNGMREEDKSKKILKGLEYIKKYHQDYVMVADADDYISNKIVAYVEENKAKGYAGWYFDKGYLYREGDKFISLNKRNFNSLCGTCIIVKPHLLTHIFKKMPHLLYVHHTIKLTDEAILRPFPSAGAIYNMANGENHFMSITMIKTLNSGALFSLVTLKSVIRKLKKYRIYPLHRTIKNEFGMYEIENRPLFLTKSV